MRIAILQFPGSNCDQDALKALNGVDGIAAEYVWHTQSSLAGFDGAFVPGGFSYGDYLRCGAIASRSTTIQEVKRLAREGRPVVGACNGFQILCEAGLLPGALTRNENQKFVCKWIKLRAEGTSPWSRNASEVRLPIAHGEGRYVIEGDELKRLEDGQGIAFRYSDQNPNGSINSIAGVTNDKGNVLGLMPHPERAADLRLGGADGNEILRAFLAFA